MTPYRDETDTPIPTEAAKDDEWVKSNRRRRALIGTIIAVLFLAGGGAVAFVVVLTPDAKCERDQVQALFDNPEIPTVAIHGACELPPPLEEAMRSVSAAPPEYRSIMSLRLATEAPELFLPVCPAFARGLAEAAAARPSEQGRVFTEHCDLSAIGLSNAMVYSADLGDVVLAMALYGALEETDSWAASRLAQRIVEGR